MIIELFGPPAAGKSTLANALASVLRNRGFEVQLCTSLRPAERVLDTSCDAARAQRGALSMAGPLRRVAKLAGALPVFISGDPADETGTALLKLLPPRGLFSRVRLRRYLSLLHQSWKRNSTIKAITIVDQGYFTALCSLAVRSRLANKQSLSEGLNLVPWPDLLVCLDAPDEVLQERLSERLHHQNALEQLFEQDPDMNHKQVEMVRTVADMIYERDGPAMGVSCVDKRTLQYAVERIMLKITAQRQAA